VTRPEARAGATQVAQAAAAAGVPLTVCTPDAPDLRALYGADYALIRPDHFVAWRGDDLDRAIAALPCIAGHEMQSQMVRETTA
jgi:hypothetical protein